MSRAWRETSTDVFVTGDRYHGAAVWRWSGDDWRLQCWTYPRNRLVTFRSPRRFEVAKKRAENWLRAKQPRRHP